MQSSERGSSIAKFAPDDEDPFSESEPTHNRGAIRVMSASVVLKVMENYFL
jgi:hypothetical protein